MRLTPRRRAAATKTTIRSRALLPLLATLLVMPGVARGAPGLDERAATLRICSEGADAAVANAERLRGEARVAAADVLPNPSLVADHQSDLAGRDEHETVIGLSVPLGIGGRRFVLQDAAEARRQQAVAQAEGTMLEAALTFRRGYGGLVLDQARLAVLEGQQQALDDLGESMERLEQGGEGAAYELLRQQSQARIHRSQVLSLRARVAASKARLEAWLGQPIKLTGVSPAQLAGGAKLVNRAATRKGLVGPRVRSLQAAARASGLEAEAAHRRWVPDLELFGGYRHVTSADAPAGHGIALGLTVPLTFFDHGQGEARQARAEQRWAEAAAQQLERARTAELRATVAQLQIIEAGLPALKQAEQDAVALQGMAMRLYAADEATITELLDAFRAIEQARLTRLDLTAEIVQARLALMAASGKQFDAVLDRSCTGTTPRRSP
ncbi:MAG: TolC family protein [Deltaproteobacteria bacterium]|nr:TolC family protein [Deltaproteobacteria bacterium]